MVQDEGEVLYPPPPAQGGVEVHQRKSPNAIHGMTYTRHLITKL